MSDKQAAALIIENIAMLEDATLMVEGELSKAVFSATNNEIQDWAKRIEWAGNYEFSGTTSNTSFWPREWQTSSEESPRCVAFFYFDAIDRTDKFWLTTFLAACNGKIGFRFRIDYNQFADIKKSKWKDFARKKNQEYPEIEKEGFQFDPKDGTWFLPWRLDAKLLAENYVNDAIEDALGPLKVALAQIDTLYPTFAKLVESAQQEFSANHDG